MAKHKHKPPGQKMKVVKAIQFQGQKACLFANGDIAWAGMIFPSGHGANLSLIKALQD